MVNCEVFDDTGKRILGAGRDENMKKFALSLDFVDTNVKITFSIRNPNKIHEFN